MESITIALDAMGGDFSYKVVLPAAIMAIKEHPSLSLILVGDNDTLSSELKSLKFKGSERLSIYHSSEIVAMDESPSVALRTKKDSSMRVAINLVKEQKADACVSSGNTGALMATARFVLKTLPGIDRPAIISALPGIGSKTYVLDLGANVDSCAEHLFQFAVMGSVLIQAVEGIDAPTVGLLNIGVEEIKGNDQVKRTAHLLSNSDDINYHGYVEGDDMYKGVVDLVVCDGFVGNIAIKSSEGIVNLVKHFIDKACRKNLFTKCLGIGTLPILKSIKKQIDPAEYNGASMLGLNGIVVKSHGSAGVLAYKNAIYKAILEVKNDVPRLISEQVGELLSEGETE